MNEETIVINDNFRDSKGRFIKGSIIGEEFRFKKGYKMSEETKQKMKGRIPYNKDKGVSTSKDVGVFIDFSKFPKDKRRKGYIDSGGYRRFKLKGKHIKEHRYIWEIHNGKIPLGYDIHHIDNNKLNNDIKNLEMIKHGEHSRKSSKNFRT